MAADHAREDSDIAQATARQFAPDFKQPGLERLKTREPYRIKTVPEEQVPVKSPVLQQNDISKATPNQVPTHNPTTLPQKPLQHQNTYKKPETNQYPSPTNYPTMNKVTVQEQQQNPAGVQQNPSYLQPNHQQPELSVVQQQVQQKSNVDPNRIPNNPNEMNNISQFANNPTSNPGLRRGSKVLPGDRPQLEGQQLSIDHFDHYKRPPSRDSSVDRYSRATGRMSMGSRQPSVDKTGLEPDVRSVRGPSMARGTTPTPSAGNGSIVTGSGATRLVHVLSSVLSS